jgi:class 3 adenylate cyclase
VPWLADPDRITTEIEEFLTGSHAAPSQSHRALRTVLFTDMVASTQHAAATGDERWRAVLHRFGEITTELTERFGGTVVKSTGDGHLATFDGPTQAIRCAEALRAEAETLGIEIRAGIHTGECELLDNDIGASPYTSRRGSSARPAPTRSSSLAPSVTWSSARAPVSRTAAE